MASHWLNTPVLRDHLPSDAAQINALALQAFEQFKDAYLDWPGFRLKIGNMSALANAGEIIVSEANGKIVGAVAFVGPGEPKAEFFRLEWAIIRMLVVAPASRGHGIGRALVEESLLRARRDGASEVALHTSEIMHVALLLYERMGFKLVSTAPVIHGVNYGVYVAKLDG